MLARSLPAWTFLTLAKAKARVLNKLADGPRRQVQDKSVLVLLLRRRSAPVFSIEVSLIILQYSQHVLYCSATVVSPDRPAL